MTLSKCFRLAFSSILSSKMRAFLTMLGIIIGIMAVIVLTSLMNGVTTQINDMFASMGTNTITVQITARGGSRQIRPKDMYAFIDEHPDLFSGITPSVGAMVNVRTANDSEVTSTRTTGVSEQLAEIRLMDIEEGRFLRYVDIAEMQKVCVIGTYTSRKFFGMTSPVGQVLKINGIPYTVVGLLEESAESAEGSSDDAIYIPYTNAMKIAGNASVSNYTLAAATDDLVNDAMDAVKKYLRGVLGSNDFFSVSAMQELLSTFNTIMGTLSTVLVVIAGISLLVGGIGIMNIMLVSVTERTKEIGIRKSLGARRRDILLQFVMEAGVLSGIGGVIGIFVGIGCASLAGSLMDLTAVPTFSGVALAFSVSVGIGVAFGYLPAKKAAGLNPIDALRFE